MIETSLFSFDESRTNAHMKLENENLEVVNLTTVNLVIHYVV